MGRYNFSAEELQRRAALSADLKKKVRVNMSAAEAESGAKTDKKKEEKKEPVAPKIDYAAIKAQARDRRNFILGTASFAGGMTVTLGGTNRFMFPRVLFEPPSSFTAGRIDDYLANQPIFYKDFKTWIIRTTDRIYALSGRCTHLGCTPSWLASDGKFKCPCHGSGFRMTGVNFEGPAPRALERFKIALVNDQIQVDKSKMFFYEKGDWEKPESYLLV